MEYYLAAPSTHVAYANEVIAKLVGYTLAHDWVAIIESAPPLERLARVEKRRYAQEDLDAVERSDVLIALFPGPSQGRSIEIGYALAKGVPVIAVAPPDDIWWHLPGVTVVPDLVSCLRVLEQMEVC
jgi:nucleoside 2-deoxyribosyltransferase